VAEVFRRFLAGAFGLRLARVARVAAIALDAISSIFSTSGGISAVASAQTGRVTRSAAALDADLGKANFLEHARDRLVRREPLEPGELDGRAISPALADGEIRHANTLLLR
jgi:hypothetical protein